MGSQSHHQHEKSEFVADALASLADHLAVLDRDATILAVNDAWNTFGVVNGVSDVGAIGPGVNYLDVCASAARAGEPHAVRALEGIKAVCKGRRAQFELEYPCNGPFESRRFLMTVTPFQHAQGQEGIVVSHRNITASRSEARTTRQRSLARLASVKLHNLTASLVTTAREEERRRIARELHDDVNQRLALLAIGIDQVSSLSRSKTIGARLHDLWVETTRISKGVHDLSHELHSPSLGVMSLVPALRTLSQQLLAKGLAVTVTISDPCNELAEAAALCLFRVAQEALSNVLRHSGTLKATVSLKEARRSVLLRVEDRGRGFNPRVQDGGLGLRSMRERLVLVGGDLLIRAWPGGGTVVEARVPRSVRHRAAPTLTPEHAA